MSTGAPPRTTASASAAVADAANPPSPSSSSVAASKHTSTSNTSELLYNNNNKSNNNNNNNSNTSSAGESMATMTTTRRQLQSDVHSLQDGVGGSSQRSNSGVPRSSGTSNIAHLPLFSNNNTTKSTTKSSSNNRGTSASSARSSASSLLNDSGPNNNSWQNSWSSLQNFATSVLQVGNDLNNSNNVDDENALAIEEERKRRIRIAERRRRAGLDSIVGAGAGKSSASSAGGGGDGSSIRSRISTTSTDGDISTTTTNSDLRPRGRRKGSNASITQQHYLHQPQEQTPHSSHSSAHSRKIHKRASSPDPTTSSATSTIISSGVNTTHSTRHKPPTLRAISSPPSSGDAFTLAYIHPVRPTDTLEGVVIAYNIQPSALRRANRLWMGDSIQVRKELLLPVDECLVKGKPVVGEDGDGILPSLSSPPGGLVRSNTTASGKSSPVVTRKGKEVGEVEGGAAVGAEGKNQTQHQQQYTVHSVVTISGIGTVRIARLPRKEMSHFPPRRQNTTATSNNTTGGEGGDEEDPNSVFASRRAVAHAYNPSNTGGEIPTFGQMFTQVARETRDGVENVGSFVEGFVRRIVVKVGELAKEEDDVGIELDERRRRGASVAPGGSIRNGSVRGTGSEGSSRNGSVREGAGAGGGRGSGRRRREGIPSAAAFGRVGAEGKPLSSAERERERGRS